MPMPAAQPTADTCSYRTSRHVECLLGVCLRLGLPDRVSNDFFVNLTDMSTVWTQSSIDGIYEGRDAVGPDIDPAICIQTLLASEAVLFDLFQPDTVLADRPCAWTDKNF